jgi:asparagine synthase (glutamine-hydrolysing)
VDGGALRRLVEATHLSPNGLLSRYLALDQHYYLADDILYKTDRMSMAHSLEVRPPFLDHRIVEYAASLPSKLKIRGFRQKYVLRELLRGKLPDSILDRKKTGFDIPTHEWFRGPLRELLQDTLSGDVLTSAPLFREAAIRATIRCHMERRINAGYHLWGLLTLFLWMKRWKVTVPCAGDAARRPAATAAQ